MTNKELQEKLKGFPDDMRAVTRGFDEGDYDDIATIEPVRLILNKSRPGLHWGEHEEAEGDEGVECLMIDY